ncbi:hypothetical protein [Zhongshania sp.]|uniref:hypothetical protein n=1 Tax=Zhongshania sp. TaxID=1971902 RepID=UPI00356AE3E1
MAISTSINFTVTRDQIIKKALQSLGVLGEGEDPNSEQIDDAAFVLNGIIKAWQADGLNLFAVQRLYLFPEKGQHEYSIGPSASTNITAAYRSTTVAADASGTTLTVDDDVSFVAGDYVGVQLDGTTVQWTTVDSVTNSTEVELADSLSSTAAEGNTVFVYTTKANRPMKVLEGYTTVGNTEIPVGVISRTDYNTLGVKTTDGIITQMYYDPQIGTGKLFVYPEASSELNFVTLFVQKTLADLDAATDNPEVPQEWYLALAYNLAEALVPDYGTPTQDAAKVERLAKKYYDMAYFFDNEAGTSIILQPNTLESF